MIGESESIEQNDSDPSKSSSHLSFVLQERSFNLSGNFPSDPTLIADNINVRQICSDLNFGYQVNYDDLCGPWTCPKISAYQNYNTCSVPKICCWIFIGEEDMFYIRKFQHNKEAILTLIGIKVSNDGLFNSIHKEIFLQLMWEVFRFIRDEGYNEISISSLLGLLYITHRFCLSSARRTAAETYNFFKKGVLLHSIMHPPKSTEIFTPAQCKQSLDLFCTMYMRSLALLRLVCLPNYKLILTAQPQAKEEEEERQVMKKYGKQSS